MFTVMALLSAMTMPSAFPTHAGECQWVHGRFVVANGSSINRLFVSGTRHALALQDDDERVPPAIEHYWNGQWFDHSLWGDFYVCARERFIPGHMQHIRILRTRRTMTDAYRSLR